MPQKAPGKPQPASRQPFCTFCGTHTDHTVNSCPQLEAETAALYTETFGTEAPEAKQPAGQARCGFCHQPGHTDDSCPELDAETQALHEEVVSRTGGFRLPPKAGAATA